MDQQLRDFVVERFGTAHSATPCLDYPKWSRVDRVDAQPSAALGYRDAGAGPLFLEAYLDRAVEELVSNALGEAIDRREIVEIGCLAAIPSRGLVRLWHDTARTLAGSHRIAVATLTHPLRAMLERVGLPLVPIAKADAALIADAGRWGSYYRLDPVICAGDITAGASVLAAFAAAGPVR
jgi:hypothetical protein